MQNTIELLHSLILDHGGGADLQSVLECEYIKQDHTAFLTAFKEDVTEMDGDTLRQILEDKKTSTECLQIAVLEMQYRPRRIAIQNALLHRARHGTASEASLAHKLPEYISSEKLIIEVEETREETDIALLLKGLHYSDDRMCRFDKELVAIVLGRTLLKWKKPLRPYIMDLRFSKQDTMIALYNFKLLISERMPNKPIICLLDNINHNLSVLVNNSTVRDYLALLAVERACKNDIQLIKTIEEKKLAISESHPEMPALLHRITIDQNDPAYPEL